METHASFRGYNLGTQIAVNNAPVTNNVHIPSDLAERLPMVHEATFNSFEDQHEDDCLEGTRIDVLNQIEEWALSHNSSDGGKCIFWLNGMAGTGKTTISRTIATIFSQADSLGASFFFRRGEGDRGNATKLISTLVRQLATTISGLRPYIEQAVRDDPDIAKKEMGKQFQALIMNPLRALSLKAHPSTTSTVTSVVVIDALDECERDDDVRLLLRLLPDLQESKSVRIRLFLTSRPELEIRLGFSKFSNHKDFILHEIPQQVVNHDLSLFLNHRLSKIRKERSLPSHWPGSSTVERLVVISSPLFILAATICRTFEDRAFDPIETLDEIMMSTDNISKLDRTYLSVLKRILKEPQDERHKEHVIRRFRQVVGVIVMLESPLSVHSLSRFLNITENIINATLDLLYSVLSVPTDMTLPVRLFHLSFRDFLTDPETIKKTPLGIDINEMHQTMTIRCLEICQNTLRKNICQLPTEGTRRATLNREILNSHLPPEMSYACRYWGVHLIQFIKTSESKAGLDFILQHSISFLKTHFLHWFEAMSLLGFLPELLGTLDDIYNLLSGGQGKHESKLLKLLVYAKPFVLRYSQIADEAPLQLYCAGLIFTPQNATRKGFEGDLPEWVCHLPQVDANWGQEISNFEGHEDPVRRLVFSPDGLLLASISVHTIRLWDFAAGTLRHSFQTDLRFEFDDHCQPVVFSPDSRLLASVPHAGPIRLWNIVTGAPQKTPLPESTDIQNVRFSSDGRMLASVSKKGEIRLHDLQTNTLERSLRTRSTETALRIFSGDLFLASGFPDGQISFVDLIKGAIKPAVDGHSTPICGMTFSPDGHLLATVSRFHDTIRLWDVKIGAHIRDITPSDNSTRTYIDLYGLTQTPPQHMIFSPSSRILAFVTAAGIQLRDVKTGEKVLTLSTRFSESSSTASSVRELAFSRGGSILVFAGSGGEVSLWDCATGLQTRSYRRHTALMTSATIAPNNNDLLMVSGGENGTVGLLDLTTPELSNDVVEIEAMIFSPDGRLLASKSLREIHIWDTLSGTKKHTLARDFDFDRARSAKNRHGEITSMAFDHDNTFLALVESDMMRILLYDVSKGALKKVISYGSPIIAPWAGDSSFLAFSPKGILASGYSRYVVLWDPVTGARLHQLKVEGTLTGLDFTHNGLSLSTTKGGRVVSHHTFPSNSFAVNLHVAFEVFRIQGLLRSVGIKRGLREICGLKKHKEANDTAKSIVFTEIRQSNSTTIANPELECPQIYIKGKQWIVLNGKRAVWLPLEFRPELGGYYKVRVDGSGGMIALGTMSGRVYFIGFDMSSCT